jgi:hypothetical protein
LSKEYAESIEYVCDRMGVSDENLKHNKANNILVDSSKKLGYPIARIPVSLASFLYLPLSRAHCLAA